MSDEPDRSLDPLLDRFVVAQDSGGTYEAALDELRRGRKTGHWMWFVFPQIAGLGRSATAAHFAIADLPEAVAYCAHPVLGPRLRTCARMLTELSTTDPVEVFGPVDAQKLHSSMTLFSRAASEERVFHDVLERFFGGALDEGTLRRI
jgi:uncharacterized protein (DUF1810 family)